MSLQYQHKKPTYTKPCTQVVAMLFPWKENILTYCQMKLLLISEKEVSGHGQHLLRSSEYSVHSSFWSSGVWVSLGSLLFPSGPLRYTALLTVLTSCKRRVYTVSQLPPSPNSNAGTLLWEFSLWEKTGHRRGKFQVLQSITGKTHKQKVSFLKALKIPSAPAHLQFRP